MHRWIAGASSVMPGSDIANSVCRHSCIQAHRHSIENLTPLEFERVLQPNPTHDTGDSESVTSYSAHDIVCNSWLEHAISNNTSAA